MREKCLFLVKNQKKNKKRRFVFVKFCFLKDGIVLPKSPRVKSTSRQSLFISSLRMWSASSSGGAAFQVPHRVYLVLQQSAACDKPQTFQPSWRKGSLIAASWERSLPSSDQVGAIEREMPPLRVKVWGCNSWKQGEGPFFGSLMNNSSLSLLLLLLWCQSCLRRQRTPYTPLSSSLPLSSADGGSAELLVSETDGGKSRLPVGCNDLLVLP